MASIFERPYVLEPKDNTHARTIIFLHGRGDQGEEFADSLFEGKTLTGQSLLDIFAADTKWIFPSAPERYSTAFQMGNYEWFDIRYLSDPNARQDLQKEGLKESIQFVSSLISEEISTGMEPKNIILGGISQGFATAVHVLLSGSHVLGGCIGVCGWLPFSDIIPNSFDTSEIARFYQDILSITASTSSDVLKTPILLSHARDDNFVEINLGETAKESLKKLGFQIEWHEYEEGGHWINEPQGFDDICEFVNRQVQ